MHSQTLVPKFWNGGDMKYTKKTSLETCKGAVIEIRLMYPSVPLLILVLMSSSDLDIGFPSLER